MTTEPAFEPWDGYEDEDDEEALIRRLELQGRGVPRPLRPRLRAGVCAAVASHEQLKQQRSDDRYRSAVHQRASELYDDVGGWQRS